MSKAPAQKRIGVSVKHVFNLRLGAARQEEKRARWQRAEVHTTSNKVNSYRA